MAVSKQRVTTRKRIRKSIAKGVVHIAASFNNTTVTITDEMGNVICWTTAGSLGFKGSKKSTPYAAQQAVEAALSKAKESGIKELAIRVQGPGGGRETAIKSVGAAEGIKVTSLKDVTPLPHNGCRPPKRRRV
ncbi:MAG: 30S ribosomal protein S11 [Helicobacteraceae bacterium]|jgi:small subunit ribosomal protein S11|nr:30S ribosomal protein S11 [Helicobacteraceae bacterium]